VLSLLAWVFPSDVPWVADKDRSYAAEEAAAFAAAWLSSLACPVVNFHSPAALCGCAWPYERWLAAAVECGVPVAGTHAASSPETPYRPWPLSVADVTVTVVRGRAVGTPPPNAAEYSLRLAAAAALDVLVVQFTRANGRVQFAAAHSFPDVADPAVATALREALPP
jgi:hypothetical protein